MTMDADERTTRALAALEGTALGDAFGERWFIDPYLIEGLLAERALPRPPWQWMDDTAMAASVYAVLREAGALDREANVPSGLRGVRPAHALAGGWLHPRGRCSSPPDTVHHSMDRRDGKRTQSQNQSLQPTQGSPGLRWAMRLPACFPVPSRTDRTRRPVIL